MGEAEARLKAIFAADDPPVQDAAFATAVIERMARRHCLEDMALLAGLSALGGAALWALWPSLQPFLTAVVGPLAPTAALLSLALSAVAAFGGRPGAALGMES